MSFTSRVLVLVGMCLLAPSVLAGLFLDAAIARRAAQHQGGAADSEGEGGIMSAGGGKLKGDFKLPDGARLEKDVAYGQDAQQRLDAYVPANANGAPILFMVHGGAWMIGDKAYLPVVEKKVGRWLPKGYVLISVNYRMSRSPNPLDQLDDVAHALAYVQSHASTWGADPKRVLVMGHSAGAHLVSLLNGSTAVAERAGVKPWLGTVSLDSAILNVPETMDAKHYPFYDKVFGKDRSVWEAASPYHQMNRAPSPMLMVCSSGRADSCKQAEAFAAKVKSLGGKATVMPVDMKHGDLNANLGANSDYTANVENFIHGLGLP